MKIYTRKLRYLEVHFLHEKEETVFSKVATTTIVAPRNGNILTYCMYELGPLSEQSVSLFLSRFSFALNIRCTLYSVIWLNLPRAMNFLITSTFL